MKNHSTHEINFDILKKHRVNSLNYDIIETVNYMQSATFYQGAKDGLNYMKSSEMVARKLGVKSVKIGQVLGFNTGLKGGCAWILFAAEPLWSPETIVVIH